MNVLDFQRVWGDPPKHLTERAAAQSHVNDLCALFGQPKPTDDPDADHTFARGAEKLTGGQDFADVWKRNAFAWECKRRGDSAGLPTSLMGLAYSLRTPVTRPAPERTGSAAPAATLPALRTVDTTVKLLRTISERGLPRTVFRSRSWPEQPGLKGRSATVSVLRRVAEVRWSPRQLPGAPPLPISS